ncbi:MAG: hypothetical protein KGZ80_10345 [Methylomonas sp.]|nr:hypothetical protein [Methylomonas sp.]PPD25549.1 MAG: hypothetical protein CTY22_08120 [Methylomonas sp.]PPD36459.1 MAG: hypothetical protein CTY21_08120 [Methylomonas sp.]PPD39519.1 MAG: hypothetical protein CTY17_08050 [Methylomonas sp.]PPD55634.1 MAG: hypothetical protein CTY11_01265 [Methylomonas sp.]
MIDLHCWIPAFAGMTGMFDINTLPYTPVQQRKLHVDSRGRLVAALFNQTLDIAKQRHRQGCGRG